MAGAPRICALMSAGSKTDLDRLDLHRFYGVVGVLYGLNLHILDSVWEQELVDDVDLVLVERSDGFECVHVLDKRLPSLTC